MSDPPLRVLSLLSASTEIVCRLGCAPLLVGRSHGCDDPPLVTSLPIATAPHVDPNAPSAELDAAVRAQSVVGGPVYQIRNELVLALKPDVILTQEQCRICAVTPEDVEQACKALPAAKMVTIMPVTLDDVLGDIVTISKALDVEERGHRLVGLLRRRLETVGATVGTMLKAAARPPTLAHIEWLAPVMGSGYWIAECVETAGCRMVHGSRGGHSTALSGLRELSDAEVLVLAPCGFSIERTHSELQSLQFLESAEWRALPAVQNGRVYVADGNLHFNRSSCTVVETAEMLAEMAWPDLRGLWGHHGKHWVALRELAAFSARSGAPPPTKRIALAEAEEKEATARSEKQPKTTQATATTPPLSPAAAGRSFQGPAAFVQHQVDLLRLGSFEGAFSMNSAANRARLGSADKFRAVVGSSPCFAALADPANPCRCLEDGRAAPESGRHTVQVSVEQGAAGEGLRFAFEVSEARAGEYATEGVRTVC